MTNSLTSDIIEDFFFEQEEEFLNPGYRHGLLRSFLVVGRSLSRIDRASQGLDAFDQPLASVAVVFFANELSAAQKAPASAGISMILKLDAHRLGFIRNQLGVFGTLKESGRFVRRTLAKKGNRYLGRLAYPLLAWLLYCALCKLLAGKPSVTLVTTNMVHPLSIACARAAVDSGQTSVFFEHATTPRIIFRDRGYARYFVQFPHTRQMMIELGAVPDTVVALLGDGALLKAECPTSLKTVGICINEWDALDSIADTTLVFLNAGIKVILRVHDADPRAEHIAQWASQNKLGFESAKDSPINDLFGRVDMIIAGNSNVLADALICGKMVLYYWSGAPAMFDYYDLVAQYQLPHAVDTVGLKAVLNGLQCG
jgi:hypothetical protein